MRCALDTDGGLGPYPCGMTQYDAYIICTAPRSGSTLLCHLLRGLGTAGYPGSHFHKPSLDAWLQAYDLNHHTYSTRKAALTAVIEAAKAKGRGGGPLFGLRLQHHSLAFFLEQLALLHPEAETDAARLQAVFGKTLFVHLRRAETLDQAISYLRAEQSGLWHKAPDGREIERLSAPQPPVYDGAAIAAQKAAFEKMTADWQAWFAKEGIMPLRLSYQALADAPYDSLARVVEALGLPPQFDRSAPPPVAKLADDINADWAQRFRAEGAD